MTLVNKLQKALFLIWALHFKTHLTLSIRGSCTSFAQNTCDLTELFCVSDTGTLCYLLTISKISGGPLSPLETVRSLAKDSLWTKHVRWQECLFYLYLLLGYSSAHCKNWYPSTISRTAHSSAPHRYWTVPSPGKLWLRGAISIDW